MERQVALGIVCVLIAGGDSRRDPRATAQARVADSYAGPSSLIFEKNIGQTDSQARFVARSRGGNVFLTSGGNTVFALAADHHGQSVFTMNLLGARTGAEPRGLDQLASKANYFIGADASRWITTKNPIQAGNAGSADAFVAELDAVGNALLFATYWGGSGPEGVLGGSRGNSYLTGTTVSTDFPTKNAAQPSNHGLSDAFVTKMRARFEDDDHSEDEDLGNEP